MSSPDKPEKSEEKRVLVQLHDGFCVHLLGVGSLAFLPFGDHITTVRSLPGTWAADLAEAIILMANRLGVSSSDLRRKLEEKPYV